MNAEPKDIKTIFSEAIEKETPEERTAYLDQVCGNNTDLRSKVEALIKAHNEAGNFLEFPVLDPSVTLGDGPLTEGPSTIIGRYKLLEKIGEGGMASVYMAEQKQPIRRRVALKIIKLGMDTKQVIARFEAERQALAMMDHPNIAHVFDAGTTESGRPYFVMELVRGVSITEFCDKTDLSTRERLNLFISVCQAVQHAHQKGIIHRDIKPSNIMVTLHDGEPVPKVIDFGIAKAVNQQLTEKTVFTRYAQMIGTPAYMSPEQAEMSGLDVDIRTDVFSLGVLLYELLTGTTPFDPEYLLSQGYGEMQRIIREEEPTRPSTKISTLGDALIDIAKHRRTSPELLPKLIRPDLDWIVMKTLEKDRNRRYDSISEFMADIKRHLNHEPVLAGPPSTLYRVRKFVRRRRALVAAASTVAAVVVVGFVVSTVMYLRAEQAWKHEAVARTRAEQAESTADEQRQLAEERRAEAETARDEAQQYSETLKTIMPFFEWDEFVLHADWAGLARNVPVGVVLTAAAEDFEKGFKGPALLRAKAYGFFRWTLPPGKAEPYGEKAIEIRLDQLGENDPLTLATMNNMGSVYIRSGQLDKAEPHIIKALDIGRRALGESHLVTLDSTECLARLVKELELRGMDEYNNGYYDKAVLTLSRTDRLRRSWLNKPSRAVAIGYHAMALHELGQAHEARVALERQRHLCEDNQAVRAEDQKCLWKAERLLSIRSTPLRTAWERLEAGKLDEVTQLLDELKSRPGPEDMPTTDSLQSLTRTLARAYYLRATRSNKRGGPVEKVLLDYEAAVHIDPELAVAFHDLARLQAATPVAQFRDGVEAVKRASKACELTDWKNPLYVETLAAAYAEAGDFDSAVSWQNKAIDLFPREERETYHERMKTRLNAYQSRLPYRMPKTEPMVAWWKLDETDSQTAIDSTGNGRDGRLVGDSAWCSGRIGGALSFDGEGDYIDCGNDPAFDITDEITVACWIKVSQFTTFCQAVVAKSDSSWRLQRWWTTPFMEFSCHGIVTETNELGTVVGSVDVSDSQWHHVAGVYDGQKICLYIDGNLDNFEFASGKMALDDYPVLIGSHSYATGPGGRRYWNGLIDDVRIYNYALNESEIKAICTIQDSGPIEKPKWIVNVSQ